MSDPSASSTSGTSTSAASTPAASTLASSTYAAATPATSSSMASPSTSSSRSIDTYASLSQVRIHIKKGEEEEKQWPCVQTMNLNLLCTDNGTLGARKTMTVRAGAETKRDHTVPGVTVEDVTLVPGQKFTIRVKEGKLTEWGPIREPEESEKSQRSQRSQKSQKSQKS